MFWIFIWVALIIGLIIWGAIEDGIGSALLGGIVGAMGGLVILLIAFLIGSTYIDTLPADKYEVNYKEPITLLALQDIIGVEGSSFLGSGHFGDELQYIYLYDDNDMGIKAGELNADYTYIKFVSNEKPYIQPWVKEPTGIIAKFLWKDMGYTHYTVYLPEGSVIINAYEVDLE